ncbi:MAG: hypothetical protein E7356_02635 [Clostridiales bacterium]|nr:hypothetical protein [Clostridiales bacterium]
MVKRILKILGIVFGSAIIIIGGAIGISFLSGGFDHEEIMVTHLYFDNDPNVTKKQYLIFDDIVTSLQCEPFDATDKTITLKVLGLPEGQESQIVSIPKTVQAGEEFTIKVKKDANGNNIGGVVTIQAKSGVVATVATIQLYVDVPIPNDVLYFSGNNVGQMTTTGKQFSMAISDRQQYIYLNSTLVNAFHLQAGNENIKNTQISYIYKYPNGNVYDRKDFSNNTDLLKSRIDKNTGLTNYYYEIPVTADTAGYIEIEAKTHRTSEIENAFTIGEFDKLSTMMRNSKITQDPNDLREAGNKLAQYNAFLNKYIVYFDKSEESYAFFKGNPSRSDPSKVSLETADQVDKSMEYVFVKCSARIDVKAIKLNDFTSKEVATRYEVFQNKLYSITGDSSGVRNIREDFGLKIITDNEASGEAATEKEFMFESLVLNSYLYISAPNTEDGEENIITPDGEKVVWNGVEYDFKYVYGFNGNTPITTRDSNNEEVVGYLLQLTASDEYLNIKKTDDIWQVNFNVPMPIEYQTTVITKALYLGFEVSGLNDDGSTIAKETYSRIFIDYNNEYGITGGQSNLSLKEFESGLMMTNTTDIDASEVYRDDPNNDMPVNTQSIAVDFPTVAVAPSYTSVMYFAETNSNTIDGGFSKIATIGKYSFINYQKALGNEDNIYYTESLSEDDEESGVSSTLNTDNILIGERIPTYSITDSTIKNYYIQAINASKEPVRLFAVIYLSDVNGNPIDLDGRKIKFDEASYDEEEEEEIQSADADNKYPSLVVIRITDLGAEMPTVSVNSYVDNMNFYTNSSVDMTFTYEDLGCEVNFPAGFTNRNYLNHYDIPATAETYGISLTGNHVVPIREYLELKLLKNNHFTIYTTNLELDQEGNVVEVESELLEVPIVDIQGNKLDKSYLVNVGYNKQQAFNAFCNDINSSDDGAPTLVLGDAEISQVGAHIIIGNQGEGDVWSYEENDAYMIQWTINSVKDKNKTETSPSIYIDPKTGSIPYSTTLAPTQTDKDDEESEQLKMRENYVVFNTYRLEIFDVVLAEDLIMQNNLTVRYANIPLDKYEMSGTMDFTEPIPNGYQNYTLPLVNGDVEFAVSTNLIDAEGKPNLQYVDCSQATVESGSKVSSEDANQEGGTEDYVYESIDDYILYYITGNNARIAYSSMAKGLISFDYDYQFSNLVNGEYRNYIMFGGEYYTFDASTNMVNINGYELPLEQDGQLRTLTIHKGEYFPKVRDDLALIYNVEFPIVTEGSKKIYSEGSLKTGTPINVSETADIVLSDGTIKEFVNSAYISSDVINKLKPEGEEGDTSTKAEINFLYGEKLNKYHVSETGKYKIVGNSYVEIGQFEDYDGERYDLVTDGNEAKAYGVKVYLVVTFNLGVRDANSSDYTFYKAIEYELLQEDIVVKLMYQGEAVSNNHPLVINAGQTTTISWGGDGVGAGFSLSAQGEGNFPQHVKFTTPEEIVLNKTSNGLEIVVPDMLSDDSFEFTMSYMYKGKEQKLIFPVDIKKNISLTVNTDKDNISYDETSKTFAMTLDSDTYDVAELFNEYFVLSTETAGGVSASLDGVDSILEIADYIAEYRDGAIITKTLVYDILVTKDGAGTYGGFKLAITVNPKYVIDTSALSGTTSEKPKEIFNNTDLYGSYVKVYEGDVTKNDIINGDAMLLSSAEIVSEVDLVLSTTGAGITVNGGIITADKVTDETFSVTLKYTNDSGERAFTCYLKMLKVDDVKYYYSATGNFETDKVEFGATNKNLNITLSAESINISKYVRVESSNDSIIAVLVKGEDQPTGNTIINASDISGSQVYYVAYANSDGRVYEVSEYTVTITVA